MNTPNPGPTSTRADEEHIFTLVCPVCDHMGMEPDDTDPEMRAFEFTGTLVHARKLLVDHLADIDGQDGGPHDNSDLAEYIAKEMFR